MNSPPGTWRRTVRPLGSAALITLILAGCDQQDIEAPAPEVVAEGAPEVPDLPLAALAAPVVFDLSEVLRKLEEAVPMSFGDLEERMDHPSNGRIQVAFLADRGPFEAVMAGEEAHLTATLEYRVRAWYDPPLLPQIGVGCGTGDDELPPRAVLELRSPLSLSPEWVLESRVRVHRVEPYSENERDVCDITFLGIGVTGTVMDAARSALEGRSHEIDAKVAEVDVRSTLQGVWETLQEPHELTDGVWLAINPVGVTRGLTRGEGTVLTIQVGLTARPRIVVGERPANGADSLPPLEEGEVADEARILLEGYARYGPVGERLTRELAENELSLGGNLLRIRELGLQGIGAGRVAMAVTFDGSARGTVYLVGTPNLDRDTGIISVPDLEFDLETRNLLVGGLAWIARGNLEGYLRERARIPVADVMRLAEEQLLKGINRDLSDEVRVEGEVLGSDLLEAVAAPDGLLIRAEARARAVLHIQQKGS